MHYNRRQPVLPKWMHGWRRTAPSSRWKPPPPAPPLPARPGQALPGVTAIAASWPTSGMKRLRGAAAASAPLAPGGLAARVRLAGAGVAAAAALTWCAPRSSAQRSISVTTGAEVADAGGGAGRGGDARPACMREAWLHAYMCVLASDVPRIMQTLMPTRWLKIHT
jgi:hypothetical protein